MLSQPLAAWEDRGGRAKCAGEAVEVCMCTAQCVPKEMFLLLRCLWVRLAAEDLCWSIRHMWVLRAEVGVPAEGLQQGCVACGQVQVLGSL